MDLSDLYTQSPYQGFNAQAHKAPFSGWGSTSPTFKKVIESVRPQLIVEVGSWKGCSAIHMAKVAAGAGLKPKIVCIDTWLGALEFWQNKNDGEHYGALSITNGYPTVFYKFLANVCFNGLEQQVIPFPQTSLIAARWLAWKQVQADLIYIDASHDYPDVALDLAAYYPLVRNGGVLFGDDFIPETWPGVARAVTEFAKDKSVAVESDFKWVIQK
jgi:predicted O-methyltransferase YrrM